MSAHEIPDSTVWNTAASESEDLVRLTLAEQGARINERFGDEARFAALASAIGAMVASVDLFKALTLQTPATEAWAFAIVRGVLRGADEAIHEDGRTFRGAYDA